LQGDTPVMVERRSSAQGAYGQGNKAPMQLQQLIKELQQGNTGLYMSTQEVRPRMPYSGTAARHAAKGHECNLG
jgi:lauroyl/myristoyl acyltransferase